MNTAKKYAWTLEKYLCIASNKIKTRFLLIDMIVQRQREPESMLHLIKYSFHI